MVSWISICLFMSMCVCTGYTELILHPEAACHTLVTIPDMLYSRS